MSLRVLIVGPASRLPWVEYTARALERLGHRASRFRYTNVWATRSLSPELAQRLRWLPMAPAVSRRCGSWWHRANDRALIALVRRTRPDLILVLRGELISDEALATLKRVARGPLVSWWVDSPGRYGSSLTPEGLLNPDRWGRYDHVFLFDREDVRQVEALGVTQAHFLPCACDETVYRPRALSRREYGRLACEIALVSWYYPNRAQVVNALEGFRVHIWGRGWTSSAARAALDGTTRRLVRGGSFIDGDRAARIYSAAAIGLNVHHPQSREAGLNMRTFELLATGTFELVSAVPGMEELLVPGEELAAYRSPEEARDLARYYLRHAAERARIAARGRERTLREHTYVHRMRQLLHTVGAGRALA